MFLLRTKINLLATLQLFILLFVTGFIHENFWRQGYFQQSVSVDKILFY